MYINVKNQIKLLILLSMFLLNISALAEERKDLFFQNIINSESISSESSGILSEVPPSLNDYKVGNYTVNIFYVKKIKTLAQDYVVKPYKSKIYDYRYEKGEQIVENMGVLGDGMFMMLYPKKKQKCLYEKIPLVAYVDDDDVFEFTFINEYQFILKNYDGDFTLFEIQKPAYLSEYNSFLFNDEIECQNNKLQTKEYSPIDIIRSIIR